MASLFTRILGRTAAEDIKDADGRVIVAAGQMIVETDVEPITAAGVQEVKIRSVLTCETKNGVCGTCYGRDLGPRYAVNMGEAVGVIAAQSIGEPGTQLTMRTSTSAVRRRLRISPSSKAISREGRDAQSQRGPQSDGDLICMARNVAVVVVDSDGAERACIVSSRALA